MYIKRNIYYRDLKESVKESRARLVFCVLGLCRFEPKERTCDTCVVYRVNEGSTWAFCQKGFWLKRVANRYRQFIQAYSLMRVNTHTHARIRAKMCIHMQMTHTSTKYMHAYARGTCTHAPAQYSYMRTYAHAQTRLYMRPHSCKHTPTYFGCALTDWGHTSQQWVVFRKTLSLFGCLALFVLHSHGHASGGKAGGWGW